MEEMTRTGSRWVWTIERVRVFVEQRAEAPHVGRRLEQPPVTGMTTLEVLEEGAMPAVGGGHVGLVQQPPVVSGDVVLGGEDHRPELPAGHTHALLGQATAHRVEVGEAGDYQIGHGGDGIGLIDPGVGLVGGGLRWWARPVHLPGQRCPVGWILGQQVVEDGRTGSGLAQDDDGPDDPALGHLGVGRSPGQYVHPGAEVGSHLGFDDGPP